MPSLNIAPKSNFGCYLCGEARYERWATEAGYHAVRCRACSLVYVHDRPQLDVISEAVSLGLHRDENAVLKTTSGGINRSTVSIFHDRLGRLAGVRLKESTPLSWLDVGAGYGEFLLAVRDTLGGDSSLEGIEPCDPKARWAEANHGLIHAGRTLDDCPGPYDAISVMNVISHIPEPVPFMQQLSNRLRPGGLLVLETGNGAEITREEYPGPLFLPDHLAFFGETQLRRLLSKAGLRVLQINRYGAGTGRLPLLPFFRNKGMNFVRRLRRQPINAIDWNGYSILPRFHQRFATMWLLAEKEKI